MQHTAAIKLILAAGSVFLHLAIIVWIFSPHTGAISHPKGAGISHVDVFIVGPTAPIYPQPPTTVATIAPKNIVAKVPRPIALIQQQIVKASSPYYFPLNELDRGPLPKSEPDLQQVKEKSITNRPIKLRLFIDRFGTVDNVVSLDAEIIDLDFVNAVADIFRVTSFLPGRVDGNDVASFIDIEINNIGALVPAAGISLPCSPCVSTDIALPPAEN